VDATDLPMYKRALLGFGYSSQEESIFRGPNIEENISTVLETSAMSKKERKEFLNKLLAERPKLEIAFLCFTSQLYFAR